MPLHLAATADSLSVVLLDVEKVTRYDYFQDIDNLPLQVFVSRPEIKPSKSKSDLPGSALRDGDTWTIRKGWNGVNIP